MLNPKYIPLSSLGCYFVDKDSGEPLTEGLVYFYSDVNRSQLKAVYEISGSSPSYTYTQLDNPLTLSGVGTFVDDSGNPIIPYGYPYDSNGNIENYFIQVYSTVQGVQSTLQESIPAWPNLTPSSGGNVTVGSQQNFIPNGQFLAHTDIPEDILNDIPAGQISQDVTEIAYGNWTFERSAGSTATDNVQFFRYGQYVANPTASPRYAVQIQCLGADLSDVFKILNVKFNDVNKFSSDTDTYTFAFTGNTFNSSDFTVGLILTKFYGTGGSPSPTQITQLTTFTITSTPQIFQFSFSFGANTGNQVGDNNDDYVSLAVALPTDISFEGQFTDFILLSGSQTITAFPATTDKDFDVRSVSIDNPNPDGSNLYLKPTLTKDGLSYDSGDIGMVIATLENFGSSSLSATSNNMLLDGNQYLVKGYSPLGIPFSRLWGKVIFNQTILQPIYGSGQNFVSTYITGGIGTSANMFLLTNNLGSPSPPANGATSAGITFFSVFDGNSPGYGLTANVNGSASLVARATTVGWVPPFGVQSDIYGNGDPIYIGTTGFSFHIYKNTNKNYSTSAPATKLTFGLTVSAASTLTSDYWQFNILPGPTLYYMWFKVDGTGTDPAPGGTAILVNLKSTFTITDVAQCIASVLSGQQVYYLTFPAASAVTPGGYWTFRAANGNAYYVWYTVDNVGTDPMVSSILGIKVALSSTDSAAIMAQKTMTAINSTYYAAPDFRGMFPRGYDPNATWDINAGSRYGICPTVYGNQLGTFELDQLFAHDHSIPDYPNGTTSGRMGVDFYNHPSGTAGPTELQSGNYIFGNNYGEMYTDNQGSYGSQYGTETNSVNAYVNWVIKY